MKKTITYQTYFDKAFGCWLGKSIGGACGALSENNKDILDYTIDDVFPEVIPPNDDLDLQVLWLTELLEKKGISLKEEDFADAFAKHNICLANEYAVAIKNIEMGIYPPFSGVYDNDYFKNSMGCPIRSEIWAVVAPGSCNTVKRYTQMDGMVDHSTESINAEIFNGVLECLAFFEEDIERLILQALTHIPEESRLSRCVRFVLDCYRKKLDWATARTLLVGKFGSMDASYSVVNSGLTLLSLLYGEKDYTKTLLYSVNGGFDTDCTAATALSILGIITGANRTPKFWLDKIGTELVVGTVEIDCPYSTIESFAEASCRAGLSFQKAGLLEVEITDVPASITPSLPEIPAEDIQISIDYNGIPSVGVGETRKVTVELRNQSAKTYTGKAEIHCAEALVCTVQSLEVSLRPSQRYTFTMEFSPKPGLETLPMENITTLTFCGFSKTIGLHGAMRMTLIGPFWDNYDTKLYSCNPYGRLMQKKPSGENDIHAMFNGFVNADREYIDESFENLDDLLRNKDGKYTHILCEKVNIHGDVFDLEDKITYSGPACVYLVYDFIAEEDASGIFHVGCNAPAKLWHNGKLLMDNKEYFAWTAFNINAPMDIKKGRNRLIFKLTRTDLLRFSLSLRNGLNKGRYFHKIQSIL